MFWAGCIAGGIIGGLVGLLVAGLARSSKLTQLEEDNEHLLRRIEFERKRWRSIIKRLRAQIKT